ncbi:MAG: hypothetical protein AAGA48_22300 [Myxococcota bacterium]
MMAFLTVLVAWCGLAWAGPAEEAQLAELDRLRGRSANQVHLAAFDLVDEMIYGWTQEPVFPKPTPVVLASVTVPVGLGTGLQAQLENHISSVLLSHPSSNVKLVHCPTCTQVLVHSSPNATVVTRGIDNPAVWSEIATSTNQHALFIDVEAEGTFLVLRARLTALEPDLPILWSRTITSSADSPALLRNPRALTSAAEARQEYINTLRGRSPFAVPFRMTVRAYAQPTNRQSVPPPPFLWVQTGIEVGTSQAKDWTTSLLVGATFIPQAYQGLMVQGRLQRLITGRARSLTRPDLYGFFGVSLISVWGPATAPFSNERVTADDVIQASNLAPPRTSFGTLQLGADLRVGNRVGVSMFGEWIPSLTNSPNLGSFLRLGPVSFQGFGTEVTFWF